MKFGVVTDAHLAPRERTPSRFHNQYDFNNAQENFERALAQHVAARVDAIAVLGDLANNGDAHHHEIGLALCDAAGIPVYLVPGNHDCEEGPAVLSHRIQESNRRRIQIPSPAGELKGNLRIAGLPTTVFDTEANWSVALPETEVWGDEPVLVVSHIPAISLAQVAVDAGFKYAGDTQTTNLIAESLENRTNPTIVIHGHLHLRHSIIRGTTLQIGFASIIEPPHANATLEITENDGDVIVTVAHDSVAEYQVDRLPVLSPSTQRFRFKSGEWTDESATEER